MKILLAFSFALWSLAAPVGAAAQGVVFVVRHAERADTSADSPLSAAGHARAQRLAAMLKDSGIGHVYTTTLRRTVQTAAPLATALALKPTELPTTDLDALVARLQAATPQDRVLVVGHSNTLPEILKRLGVGDPITIADTEYDNLFIVIPQKGPRPIFVRLRY
jgi:broad specificity phosphatase PhoE